MTEMWTFIDGKRFNLPTAPWQADDFGWHCGVEFKSMAFFDDSEGQTITEWCKATFDPYLYRVFIRSIWFYRESDAMLCKLRWS